MSVVPFAMSPLSDPESGAHTDAADARQRMLAVKKTLDEASAAVESLQTALAAQHELEQLLKQGRAHLQDLRNRLQQAESERDRLHAELADRRATHQREVEQLSGRQMSRLPRTSSSPTSARKSERPLHTFST